MNNDDLCLRETEYTIHRNDGSVTPHSNSLADKLLISGCAILLVPTIALGLYTQFKDVPIQGSGFQKGYAPIEAHIDKVSATVTHVMKMPGYDYTEHKLANGNIVIEGDFKYKIDKNRVFEFKVDTTKLNADMNGRNIAIRHGTVVLADTTSAGLETRLYQ